MDTAEYLRLDKDTLYRLTKDGEVTYRQVGIGVPMRHILGQPDECDPQRRIED